FRKSDGRPRGAANAVLTPFRSIATDKKIYPMGAPVLIRFRKPSFKETGEIEQWIPSSGIFLNQDTGGAIKGPGRVDLFLGAGHEAAQTAGSLAQYGEVYFLVRKKRPLVQ